MRVYQETVWLAAAALALCLLPGCGNRQSAEWKVVASPGEAITGVGVSEDVVNTHAAAAAWVARYHGADDPDRTDQQFVAGMRMHIGVPACPSCTSPMPASWDIAGGMNDYFVARDRPDLRATQRFRYSKRESDQATFDDCAQAIDADQPVILTWGYLEGTRKNTRGAAARISWCFTTVGIGYARNGERDYVIVHDGLTQPLEDRTDALDRVGPLTAGLRGTKGPWEQPGTSIYRWQGEYQNLVLVFVEP